MEQGDGHAVDQPGKRAAREVERQPARQPNWTRALKRAYRTVGHPPLRVYDCRHAAANERIEAALAASPMTRRARASDVQQTPWTAPLGPGCQQVVATSGVATACRMATRRDADEPTTIVFSDVHALAELDMGAFTAGASGCRASGRGTATRRTAGPTSTPYRISWRSTTYSTSSARRSRCQV